MVDHLVDHDRIDPVHDLRAGKLRPSRTGELIKSCFSIIGTLLGALCFLLGAVLMFPAWRQAAGATAPERTRTP